MRHNWTFQLALHPICEKISPVSLKKTPIFRLQIDIHEFSNLPFLGRFWKNVYPR
jgi:hypothetical protein